MRVECVFFGPLRDAVGTKTVPVDTDARTVGDLLTELERDYPDLNGDLRGEGGTDLADDVAVTLNGRHVQHEGGLEAPLSDGDVVRLTTAVYGG